jgi:hypothetical protein
VSQEVQRIVITARVFGVELLVEVLVFDEDVEIVVGGSSRVAVVLYDEGVGWVPEQLELVEVD